MPNHLSILGIIHTAISIIAIIAAVIALLRDGKINPANAVGKAYVILTIVTCLTSLPIMKTGHPTAGHFVAVIVLLLLPLGVYARSIKFLGKLADYVQVIVMSTTLFLSMVPAIVETLTRLPVSHPLAADPAAPIVNMGLMILLTVYVGGVLYQLIVLRKQKKRSVESPDSTIKFS